MTIVLTVLIGVGLALIASCIVALIASAIVGGAIAALSGPYAAVRALIRHRVGRVQDPLDNDPVVLAPSPIEPFPAVDARGVDARAEAATSVPRRWGWVRPLATLFLISGVTVLLEGPDPVAPRRRPRRR